ncbi:phage tail tube protein [Aliivibrio sp. S4TY2]|uniref:phage tail tube protein n=1 Tax=unclassified Aliivibrio TaxID=2645654 RepID=UPI00237911E8|nr:MULTISPECIES: phage tail tube protein [unclassified Aliivibrio]MDD9154940.1 phage tail tube protein [Aliivibrio sp. S4TY2]MDD9158697.1 phage tail tube protein [Aliivibrio sp. S4TY1]MDD9162943.1 phage tail tube protein [Aliivibrio sp. S4MY2]MDD9166696.1 phage tail tube protein [Aliivibrio sp. S4MY4]MDD9184020.1 phage tail tube protein [Aliivibrio sp. S4MY3]
MSTVITSRGFLDAGSLGRLPTKEGATINFGGLKREPVMGDSGVLGHGEVFDGAPFIKVTIAHAKTTDEEAIRNFTGENLTLNTNSGKSYTLMNAWVGDPLELSVKDGQLEVTFYGYELISQ